MSVIEDDGAADGDAELVVREVLVDFVEVRTVGPERIAAVEHEGGEVLEGEGLEGGVVLHRVVLVEPVRVLQQEQDPLERLQILLGHVQHEPAAEIVEQFLRRHLPP